MFAGSCSECSFEIIEAEVDEDEFPPPDAFPCPMPGCGGFVTLEPTS